MYELLLYLQEQYKTGALEFRDGRIVLTDEIRRRAYPLGEKSTVVFFNMLVEAKFFESSFSVKDFCDEIGKVLSVYISAFKEEGYF